MLCSVFIRQKRGVVYGWRRFIVADMTEDGIDVSNKGGLVDDEKFVDAENSIDDIAVTADDKYVIMEVYDYGSYFLKVWDVEAGKWKKIDGKREYPVGARTDLHWVRKARYLQYIRQMVRSISWIWKRKL